MDDVGWRGRWVGHADRPPRGEGRRARAGGRRDSFAARCARAPRSIRRRRRRSPRPGRERDASPGTPPRAPRSGAWVGSDSASRHTRARPGVVFSLDPRSRPRVASIAETGATGATRSEDETRSTARVQGTVRDVPPGRGWRAAARRQVNLGIAHCEPKKIAFASVQSSQRREPRFIVSLDRSLAPNGANAIRSSLRTGRSRRVAGKKWSTHHGLSRSSAAAGPRADRAPRGGRGGARFDDAERGRRWRASDASRGRGRRGAGVVDARDGVARAEARGGS